MIKNLFLITSVINIPNLSFSYTNIRSIYDVNERFLQTINTINSIKKYIPDVKILFIECSDLFTEMEDYLKKNCDYFLNLYDDKSVRNVVFGLSKSLGEGTLTLNAIDFIEKKNLTVVNFFKISGRYFLSDKFSYSEYNNDLVVVQKIDNNPTYISTFLYKLNNKNIFLLKKFLLKNYEKMINCIGYEVLFAEFINQFSISSEIKYITILGINGFIAVSGDLIDR